MKYGYARVSTEDQNPALQLAALKKAACRTVFKDEGISGATAQRPAMVKCLKTLQAGDTLIVRKLDRLGRSLRDLIHMLDDLKQRGGEVRLRCVTQPDAAQAVLLERLGIVLPKRLRNSEIDLPTVLSA